VTTHESNLLDQDLLRRDEIWFAEKDQTGATRLYSLLDFKVRNDLEIRKHYLQGRFGAVPFLGNMDNLLAKTDRPV
jgi:AAA15 family ATPase/GTPase